MAQVTQRQRGQWRARRGCDFVLEGVPMYDSPDLSSESSDSEEPQGVITRGFQSVNPTEHGYPARHVATYATMQPTTAVWHPNAGWQKALLQQRLYEGQLQQQELLRAEQPRHQQQVARNRYGAREPRRLPGLNPEGRESPVMPKQCQLVDDVDYVKYFSEEAKTGLFTMSSAFNVRSLGAVASHSQGARNLRSGQQQVQCLDNSSNGDKSTADYYILGESGGGSYVETQQTVNGGESRQLETRGIQTTSGCSPRNEGVHYLSNEFNSTGALNLYAIDLDNSGIYTPATCGSVDRAAASLERRCNSDMSQSNRTSVNTSSTGGWTTASTATISQYRNVVAGESGHTHFCNTDYNFAPSGMWRSNSSTFRGVCLHIEPTSPSAPPHTNANWRDDNEGCKMSVSPFLAESRNSLLGGQNFQHLLYKQEDPQVDERYDNAISDHPMPREYCYMESYLTDPKAPIQAKPDKVRPPVLSDEITGRGETRASGKLSTRLSPVRGFCYGV
ncbi:uncharacterized protein TEOVI_000102500 [Trypanosoma equiperdum]|uniref:T. brucei spp.-specific protein n=2 Tax=Trypanozoon TaxID=39700 RepID=Q584L5_TRYB2|nr:hypothetical protein Tb927.4.4900 [Trypanosoma brucei brucei TREU927]AAX80536.1 hypothetical protein Tb927.4.4900 [Trypanosoma brucei]AAZ11080.1 hypothetical protein Tb927.4.4900 [Trypanosoma brucei brucei TREU927]SCU69459.1 hypothetical protein, conserved [Trypanosoma equiperdum]